MIKPPKILSYFLLLCLFFLCISVLVPNKEINLGHIKLKCLSFKQIVDKIETSPVVAKKENNATVAMLIDTVATSLTDTTHKIIKTAYHHHKKSTLGKISKTDKLKLQYPNSFKPLLHQFYVNMLSARKADSAIRILHMGDSQIEGDRITCYIRAAFQKDFGGTGPGFIPLYDPQKHFGAAWVANTGDWKEDVIYEHPRTILNNEYGLTGKVVTLTSKGKASVSIYPASTSLPSAKKFYTSHLFIKNINKTLTVDAYAGHTLLGHNSLATKKTITELNWTFKTTPHKLSIDINTKGNPLFLGMTLDSIGGVAVDNISMRGQSSPHLNWNNEALIKSMASHLNIGMIILQYGTNVVPTIANSYNYYYYTIYKQLLMIKRLIPNVPVVVVGVGDVAFVDDGKAVSYSHIYNIKEAQKKAAFKAGFAFFDLYKQMGGHGSIIKWVTEEPNLAMPDYTHFNKRGGKLVASWIYKAIMADLKNIDYLNSEDTNHLISQN